MLIYAVNYNSLKKKNLPKSEQAGNQFITCDRISCLILMKLYILFFHLNSSDLKLVCPAWLNHSNLRKVSADKDLRNQLPGNTCSIQSKERRCVCVCVSVLPAAVLQVSAGSAAGWLAWCRHLQEEFGRAAAALPPAPASPTAPSSAAPPPFSAGGDERLNKHQLNVHVHRSSRISASLWI